jgi:hypothetical protein
MSSTSRHCSIIQLDTKGYRSEFPSDHDRDEARNALFRILETTIGTVFPQLTMNAYDELGAAWLANFTGDGWLVVIPGDHDACAIVSELLVQIDQELHLHNASHRHQRIRLRCGIGAGEVTLDLKHKQFHGAAVANVTRATDSDACRDLLTSKPRLRVAIVLTADFFLSVIAQRLPQLKTQFDQPTEVDIKDGTLEIVIWRAFPPSSRRSTRSSRTRQNSLDSDRPSVALRALRQPALYLSTGDAYNYAHYATTSGRVPLKNHLETALMLFEHVVIHCVDPARSTELRSLLAQYRFAVADGTIAFVLGTGISQPRSDFTRYLERKSEEYLSSGYGGTDLSSIARALEPTAISETIDLLEATPDRVHRDFDATERFALGIQRDLEEAEIISSTRVPSRALSQLQLTVRQICTLQLSGRSPVEFAFSIGSRFDEVTQALQRICDRRTVSRQILLSILRDHFAASPNRRDSAGLAMVEERVLRRYAHDAFGGLPHFALRGAADAESVYSFRALLDHLAHAADTARPAELGPSSIERARQHPDRAKFASHHIRVLTDRHRGALDSDPDRMNDVFLQPPEWAIAFARDVLQT